MSHTTDTDDSPSTATEEKATDVITESLPTTEETTEEPEAADVSTEPASATEDEGPAKPREKGKWWSRIRGRLGSGVVAAVVLGALTVSLVGSAFLWRAYAGASGELEAQQQVRTRSAEFARAFLLYRKSDLDGWERRLTALAAPDYRNAISQAVKMQFPVITSLEADSQVSVREVFVNDFDGTLAKTMVVADTQVTSKDFVRTVTGMRLLVEVTKVKNRWLISGIGVLGIDDETMTDHQGNELDPNKIETPEVTPSTTP